MKTWVVVWTVILTLASNVWAQSKDNKDAPPATVLQGLKNRLGKEVPVTHVRRSPVSGLWEFSINGDVLYTDVNGRYLFQGNLIDLNTRENLTEARSQEINKVDFSKLPFELALKTVRGNGQRVFVMFADPNCVYCKKIEKDIEALTDVTIYTFFIPILSEDSHLKARQIWCSPDRQVAWDEWMLQNKAPSGEGNCEHPVDRIMALGRQLRINGTPTLFFPDGRRVPGAIPLERVETLLNETNRVIKK
jgi:thiol:disulfide interchange protein DsbC